MSKVAITGTIASGKTTVSMMIKEKGFHVFNCDEYNAYLLEKDKPGYLKVREFFPECFINDKLDKKALAKIIFEDPEKKKALENILHPMIIDKMLEESKTYDPFFAEVPLLFENGLERYFDISVLVVANKQDCIERLRNKGYTRKQAIERINNQMPVQIKRKKADKIIYNKNNFASLQEQVERFLEEL